MNKKGFAILKILPILLLAGVLLISIFLVSKQTGLLNFASTDPNYHTDDTNPQFTYIGNWKKVNTKLAYGNSYMQSDTAGDSVSLLIPDRYLAVYPNLIYNKNGGLVEVYIDDRWIRNIDTYSPTKIYQPIAPPLFSVPTTSRSHTIELRVKGDHTPLSVGNLVMFDGVTLVGSSLPETPPIPPSSSKIQSIDFRKLNATQYRLAVSYYWDGTNGPAVLYASGMNSQDQFVTKATPNKAVANKPHTAGITLKLIDPNETITKIEACLINKNKEPIDCKVIPVNRIFF